MFTLRLIKSESDYLEASKRLDELMDIDELTPDQENELELIAHLMEQYEKIIFPVSLPLPIDAIKFRMEQMGLKQADLVPYIGSRSKVSDILSGKRKLTLSMIRSLNKGLHIPLETLVSDEQSVYINDELDLDWSRFPIKEMLQKARSIFFPDVHATNAQIKENSEYYIRHLIEPVKKMAFNGGLFRQNVRMNSHTDRYAMLAWLAASYHKANTTTLQCNYEQSKMEIIANQLRALSLIDDGPIKARDLLQKVGIHCLVIPHLSRTRIDGASFIANDGNPAIALTLRYDRVDYFWFTLFHELCHVFHHLNNGDEYNFFLDDLSMLDLGKIETEADNFAEMELIPDAEIEERGLFNSYSVKDVCEFAFEKSISPAIVAGRIRHKLNNFRILTGLVGNGQVRYLFNI